MTGWLLLTTWLREHGVLFLGFLLAVVVITEILRHGRSPGGTAAWLLLIVFVPYVGVPLYLLFGGRKLIRYAGRKTRLTHTVLPGEVPEDIGVIERVICNQGIEPSCPGNRVHLCFSGEEIYREFITMVENARESIWITTFVLGRDEVGRAIIRKLAQRAREGIQVRLLLDHVGSFSANRHILRPLEEAGGRYAFFMPVFHSPLRGRTNLRNHRKITVVDGKYVLAGGANLAKEYMGPTPLATRWKDICFRLEGPAVIPYAEVFKADWEFATKESLTVDHARVNPSAGTARVQVVPSGPDVPEDSLYGALLTALFQARDSITIVTPYFVPDEALLQALTLAVKRGCRVRVLVPNRSNHVMADYARGFYLRKLQEASGEIFRYPHNMVHAKVFLVDEQVAVVGSANMDMRSLFLNYEIAAFIYSTEEIRVIRDWVEGLIKESDPGVQPVKTVQELFEGLVRIAAPLL